MRWQHDWMAALRQASGVPSGLWEARDAARFEVYRASFEANLTQALGDTYPVTRRLVGGDCFAGLARRWLRAHPSRSGDIHAFGAEFDAFLAAAPVGATLPYLPEVAHLEWLAHRAFHAAEAERLDLSGLAALPPDAYGDLALLPGVGLMRCGFPVHRIWQVNQENWTGEDTVNLDEGGVCLAVFREGLEIALLPLEDRTYALARALREFGTLGAALEQGPPDDAPGHALHGLVVAGLMAAPDAGRPAGGAAWA